MNFLHVCIGGFTVYRGTAAGVRCDGAAVVVDNGTCNDWFYRGMEEVTILWIGV